MEHIGLAETIEALRTELAEAVAKAKGQDIQFPVGEVRLEFQVGVTKDAKATAGVKFWVVQLGGEAGYAAASIQKVSLTLEPPVDSSGQRVRVARDIDFEP